MNATKWIYDVTDATFDSVVMEQSMQRPVIIDLWAPWCGPCRQLTPILEKLTNEKGGAIALAKINTDEEQQLAAEFGVQSLPTVLIAMQGQLQMLFQGLQSEAKLRPLFDKLAPGGVKPKPVESAPLDPAEAEKEYRKQLDDDNRNESARLGLAQLLADQDRPAEIEDLLEPIGPGGDNGAAAAKIRGTLALRALAAEMPDERTLQGKLAADPQDAESVYQLGCVQAGRGQYQQALDTLLKAAQINKKLGETTVREAMVKVFFVVGVRSELADSYRKRLTALLY